MRQLWARPRHHRRGGAQHRERRRARSRTGRASARATSRSRRRASSSTAIRSAKYITKKLSCGDCPTPCKGIVAVKRRGLTDVRRPDYETIVGLRREPAQRRPRARHRVSRRVQPLRHRRGELERDARVGVRGGRGGDPHAGRPRRHRHALGQRRGRARAHDQDGHRRGLRRVAAPRQSRARPQHVGKRQRALRRARARQRARVSRHALHLADGRHATSPTRRRAATPTGSASWNETFNAAFPIPGAVDEKETENVAGRAPRARAWRRRTSATRTR